MATNNVDINVVTSEQLESVAAYLNHLEIRVAFYARDPERRKPYSARLLGAMRILNELQLLECLEIEKDMEDVDTWVVKKGE